MLHPVESQAQASTRISGLLPVTASGQSLVLLHKLLLKHGSIIHSILHTTQAQSCMVVLDCVGRKAQNAACLAQQREFTDPLCTRSFHTSSWHFLKRCLHYFWARGESEQKSLAWPPVQFFPLSSHLPFPCAQTSPHVGTCLLSFTWIFLGSAYQWLMPT